MSEQLPLKLRWPAQQRFDRFAAGPNTAAVELVRAAARAADPAWPYITGAHGSGRTHLLIAACAEADACGRSAQYLALSHLREPGGEAIRAFGGSALLAIDDVDAIAGNHAAEHALFDLYNRCRAERITMLFAASAPPARIGIGLPDLLSRLSSCAQIALKPLDEITRRALLRERARARGIELDDTALDWLFAHNKRGLAPLLDLLERIDTASLAAQRRVTVPFLRSLLPAADE